MYVTMSAVTMVKSHTKKNVESIWSLQCTQEKMMGFDYCEEYLSSTSNKILLRQC